MTSSTTNSEALQDAFGEDGQRISPKLLPHLKNYLIDIGGTICEDIPKNPCSTA